MSKYQELDIDETINKLTRPDKIGLLAGTDFWHTHAVESLGIPRVRMSDGPNGIRGIKFFAGTPANCFPCATGLAASFDRELLERIGVQLGEECKSKGAHIWLGPTLNIQRSPLGGRGFESYSEDPYLSGWLSASAIKGAQSQGVIATPKHFVTNDQELDRNSCSSDLSIRALREVYLKAFQIAFREGKPWACMTAYNKMNSVHASHSKFLLDEILHKEWQFDGMTMSDWFGTYTTVDAIKAGLDLEMPGPPCVRGDVLERAMTGGLITDQDLNICVRRVLRMCNRAIKSGIAFDKEEELDTNEKVKALLKEASLAATVLIKNENNILPLNEKKIKKLAVIGGNARDAYPSGGGSASMRLAYAVDPLSAIREAVKGSKMEVEFAVGAFSARYLPLLDRYVKNGKGEQGRYDFAFYAQNPEDSSAKPVHTLTLDTSVNFMADNIPFDIVPRKCYGRLTCAFTPDETADWQFGLGIAGQAKLFINDKLVVANVENQKLGDLFFGTGTIEEKGTIKLEAGKTYDLRMDWSNFKPVDYTAPNPGFGAFRIGALPYVESSKAVNEAVDLAKNSDSVVIITGLNADYESEGFDRPDMKLPPGVDDMIRQVLQANKNTVVVIQSGTQCEMPWLSQAPALVQAFYGGNETGAGIASLLFGHHCPSSKLPLTFPTKLEDVPSHPFFPGRDGHAVYNEDVFVGYRGMMDKPLIACFGHGLSYTTFSISQPKLGKVELDKAEKTASLSIEVEVKNTGDNYTGAEVVQCYISPPKETPLPRPIRELAAFEKITLKPGESGKVKLSLDRGAFSYFHPSKRLTESAPDGCWVVQPGKYTIHIGTSLMDVKHSQEVEVAEGFHWMGL